MERREAAAIVFCEDSAGEWRTMGPSVQEVESVPWWLRAELHHHCIREAGWGWREAFVDFLTMGSLSPLLDELSPHVW